MRRTPYEQHIADFIEDKARKDPGYAIAYAILQLTDAIKKLEPATGEDIEAAAMHIGNRLSRLEDAIDGISKAIAKNDDL